MLEVAICGAGRWGTRLIGSVQGKSSKIRFVAAVSRDPAARKPLGERFGLTLTARYADVPASQTRRLRSSSTVQSIALAAAERRQSARRQR